MPATHSTSPAPSTPSSRRPTVSPGNARSGAATGSSRATTHSPGGPTGVPPEGVEVGPAHPVELEEADPENPGEKHQVEVTGDHAAGQGRQRGPHRAEGWRQPDQQPDVDRARDGQRQAAQSRPAACAQAGPRLLYTSDAADDLLC